MRHTTIEAAQVQPGDMIFNSEAAAGPYQLSRVRSVETRDHEWVCEGGGTAKGKAVWIDAGWTTILHPREAIAVRRQTDG